MIPATRDAASPCSPSVTWLYTSSVMAIAAWPSRSCTTFGCSPAESASVAQVWRLHAPGGRPHTNPWQVLTRVAEHKSTTARKLYEGAKLRGTELARNPLAGSSIAAR